MNLINHNNTVLGVRPEHVNVVEAGGVNAVVKECDYQGSETILTADYNGSMIKAVLPGKRSITDNSPVRFNWLPEHEHYFSTSGVRVDDSSTPQREFHQQ